MIMKKTLAFLFLLLFLCSTSVFGSDGCFVNENCTWWATMTNGDFIDSSANITIIDPSGSVIVNNQEMTQISTGKFIYYYQHNLTGNHLGYAHFYNDSGIIATATQSLQVKIPEIGISTGGIDLSGIMLIFGLICMAVIFLAVASRLQIKDYGILQLLLVICSILLLLLVPKAALDYKDHCALTPVNLSMSDTGSLDYNYDYVCVENENTTSRSFYLIMIRLTWIIAMYAFIYGLYVLYKFIKSKAKWNP